MKKPRLLFIISFVLIALLFITGSVGAAPKDGPVVSLSTAQSEYSASQEVLLTVTYTNPTKHSIRLLKWFTPVDGVEEPIFAVKVNGESVSYTGAIYKRPAATGRDYLTLKSGESIAYEVNLGDFYDLSGSGQYEINYDVFSYNLFTEKGNEFSAIDSLTSETLSLKIEGRPAKRPTPQPTPPPGGTSFNGCTVSQQSILVNARSQAATYASTAENYLGTNHSSTQRYLYWFGVFSDSRYNTVTAHFSSLSDAWDSAGVTFDCKCKQNYYAYVYPTRPYTIYLCKVFWLAPLAGTDSQGGTLIHEMSHFTVVAGTSDYVYGQTGAHNLAGTDPSKAIMNADNHEYFAENNPALP